MLKSIAALKKPVLVNNLFLSAWVVFLALAVLPLFPVSNYVLHVSVLVFVYVALGLGLNIVVGLAGLLDLGYIAFYAVGAYSYALLSSHFHLPFPIALFAGASLAAILGLLLGWPTIRARGDYLALITLGFGEIIRLIMRNWDSLTNGPRGLMNIPPPRFLNLTISTPTNYYYLGLAIAFSAVLIFWRIKHSNVGQQLTAVRDDEEAAAAIGINPVRWKLYAFTMGALLAGLAGVFFASWQRFVSPESFTLNESILVLSIVVLGGMGRFWPTIIAAACLVMLPEALRIFQNQRGLILGALLVGIVILQEQVRLQRSNKKHKAAQKLGPLSLGMEMPRESVQVLPAIYTDKPDHNAKSEVILSLRNISKKFGGVPALDCVSLQVCRGEIIGLVGANGAGKTTLFNCIAGAIKPDVGSIELYNGHRQNIDGLPVHKVAKQGVVRTFQHARFFESLPALMNAQLGASCQNTPAFWDPLWADVKNNAETQDHTKALLFALGMRSPLIRGDQMAFVDRKLVEFARVLSTRASVLLIDEPAAGMDEEARAGLVKILLEINSRWRVTIIVVEHDLNFLCSLCQRLIVLEQGAMIADGRPEDDKVQKAIQRTYYG